MGTRESLTSPHENRVIRVDPTQRNPSLSGHYIHLKRRKEKRCNVSGIRTKKNEGQEKDEGSLSIPIVPIESWEISPMKASE
jgi:hypothetical protein